MKGWGWWLAIWLVVAGSVCWAGIELRFAALQLRQLEIEYSYDLRSWYWWGRLTTLQTGAVLAVWDSQTNVPAKFWRVRENTNQ